MIARFRSTLTEVERVLGLVDLGVPERDEQSIGNEFDVLAHQDSVHADEGDGEGVGEELLLNLHSLADDHLDSVGVRTALEVGEEKAGKVGVESLVARDELVGEGETGHESSLLEPEDRSEGSREEDSLDGGEGDQTLAEDGPVIRDPLERPLGLALDAGDCRGVIEVS